MQILNDQLQIILHKLLRISESEGIFSVLQYVTLTFLQMTSTCRINYIHFINKSEKTSSKTGLGERKYVLSPLHSEIAIEQIVCLLYGHFFAAF